MKVIIAGSRGITSPEAVWDAIDACGFEITEIVSGGARGVDRLGEEFAKKFDPPLKCTKFIPDWDLLGKSAGIIRNEVMGNYADALVAVWDGKSPGTKHMIQYMKKLNKPVYVSNY